VIPERLAAKARRAVSALVMGPGRVLILDRFAPRVGEVIRGVPYGEHDRKKQALDVIVPRGKPPFPVLVFIHGGGFLALDKNIFTRACKVFAHEGYVVFNINYRLAPENTFPAQFEDVDAAVRFAHDNAAGFGGDGTRLFIGGDSAGAFLASMYAAAVMNEELAGPLSIKTPIPPEDLKGLLLFCGVYDMETVLETPFPNIRIITQVFLGRDPRVFAERAQAASPIRHLDAGYPPAFICSSERDKLYTQSVAFDEALTAARVPHEALFFDLQRYPRAPHGFLSLYFLKCTRIAIGEALRFLDSRSAGS
jgi:acetyl esterase/lipase